MIEYLRENPTWRGVLIVSGIMLVASLCGAWYFSHIAADKAIGSHVERFEALLDRWEKMTISQTNNQQIHLPANEAELRDRRLRDIHKTNGTLAKEDQ